jgi:2-oxoglutarate ferredoxin oxidoreductase subunit beta
MPVVVIGGDGALYGEGGNHFLHACRGNHDMTILVHDNGVYGLTKGQTSPAAQQGYKSKTTPEGIIERPVYALLLALTQGATFIAQGFTGNLPQLSQLITAAMNHRGFAVVNILQPCVTFNKTNTYGYYFQAALEKCSEPMSERFPLGILYQTERPSYTDNIAALKDGPLVQAAAYTGVTSLIPWFE